MRHFLKTCWHRLGTGAFWAVALLVLPNCAFDPQRGDAGANLYKGPIPRSSAIFCDIEKPFVGRHCANDADLAIGIRLTDAAVALNTGQTSTVALDYSAEALARCSGGPEAVLFEGAFPEGFPVCLNCGEVIGSTSFPDVNAACAAQCYDLFGEPDEDGTINPENPPAPVVKQFCDTRARASTNMPVNSCLEGACPDEGGSLHGDFMDPRRVPDPVVWTDLVGTAAGPGGTLTRTAADTGNFDAGAVSTQWFTRGNGFVEFSAGSATQQHVLGLSEIPAGCPFPCPDTSQDFTTINYAFALALDGFVYVVINGAVVVGPDQFGSFGTYAAGERFRVSVADQSDGTATINFGRVIGTCTPRTPCNVTNLFTHTGVGRYPLRVDTALRDQGSALTDVRVVFIK